MKHPKNLAINEARLRFLYYFILCLLLISISPKHGLFTTSIALLFVSSLLAGTETSAKALLSIVTPRNLIGLGLALFACSMLNVWLDHQNIEFHNFDTGIYANQIAYYWQTGRYFSPILQMHALGEHFTPALLAFAPLVAYLKSFLVLPFFKVIAFYISAYLIYLISRELLGRQPLALLPVLAWLINRPNAFLLEMEFQPSTLAIPLVLLAILFARQRSIWCVPVLLMLLAFKEHMALVWVCLGIYLIVEHRRFKTGTILITGGLLSGIWVYFYIMPHFAAGLSSSHAAKFGPVTLLSEKFLMILQLLSSVGFLPLLRSGFMLYFLPSLTISLLSNAPSMATIHFHYHDISMPFLFLGAVHGIKELTESQFKRNILSHILFSLLLAYFFWFNSKFPTRQLRRNLDPQVNRTNVLEEIDALSKHIRKEDQVLYTQDALGPYYFYHKNLRSILIPKPAVTNASFLICNSVKRYPLSDEEYQTLKQHLRSALKHKSHVRKRLGKSGDCSLYMPRF